MFIETAEQYEAHRQSRQMVSLTSRFGDEILLTCMNTVVVARDLIQANTYNPNKMPDQKKEDLQESIKLAGLAYGVSAWWDEDLGKFVIVDGFHRFLIMGYDYLGLSHVPIVPLDHLTAAQRLIATWLFNKARGFHQVDLDADLIRMLADQGMSDKEITMLGIDEDTIHRYKQLTGIAELFKGAQYSMAWHMEEGQ
jgi:ParB-like chromosome segregation protein Spo0J